MKHIVESLGEISVVSYLSTPIPIIWRSAFRPDGHLCDNRGSIIGEECVHFIMHGTYCIPSDATAN